MGSPKRYENLEKVILKILTKPMSTNQIQGKFGNINWRTIHTRLERLWKQKKVKKTDLGYIVIWEKL